MKLIVIAGPTSSGKSDLAVKLAKKINGEIISADSRQVYKGLDIGTGKISKKEMKGVPHYMLSITSPLRKFSVEQYKRGAEKAIKQITKKGKIPILVGGSGQYIDAVVYNQSFPTVKANVKLRAKLEKKSLKELQKMLEEKDPERFSNIDTKNKVRLVRALEIVDALGKVPKQKKNKSPYDLTYIGLKVSKEELEKKICKRFAKRFNTGLLDEVKKLRKTLSWKRLESLGLEYRLAAGFLQGKLVEEDMQKLMIRENIKYAKRQMTWFKKNKDIVWLKNTEVIKKVA